MKSTDRTKSTPTPKAPQNQFTKNQWINFRNYKLRQKIEIAKGKKGNPTPFQGWPQIYKQMSKLI